MDATPFEQLSSEQHGVFSRDQLMTIGATSATIRQRLRSGSWTILLPSVYGLVGHRDTWVRRLWVAHLHAGPGSVVGLRSAARLHGDTSVPPGHVELLVRGGAGRAPAGVRWHRRVDLTEQEVIRRPGLPPMTTPARTAVDLAAVLWPARLRRFVESAVVEKRCTLAEVGSIHARVRRSGKRGVLSLERILDAIGPGDAIARTELERLGDRIIELAGVPQPVFEHPLPNARGRSGFVDRCWPDARFIVELDGRRWHDRSDRRLQDADRRTEAQLVGYETLQILWEHATSDQDRQSEILAAIHNRRAAWMAAFR